MNFITLQNRTFSNLKGFSLFVLLFVLSSCVEKIGENNGDPGSGSGASGLFDFNTKPEVPVSIDYNKAGYKALFELYAEDPMVTASDGSRTKRAGVVPFFSAYTDEECSFTGKVKISSAVKQVYLYTEELGLPSCVPLEVTASGIRYEAYRGASAKSAFAARAAGVSTVNGNLKSLCTWGQHGKPDASDWYGIASGFDNGMFKRICKVLKPNKNNSQYATSEEKTNIYVTEDTKLDLTFVGERASNKNAFGYYYYPTGQAPAKSEIEKHVKYILFPNTSVINDYPYQDYPESKYLGTANAPLSGGEKVHLQYFGPNYDQEPTDVFPAGVTIGWFIIGYGFTPGADSNTPGIVKNGRPYYSNELYQNDGVSRCVTLLDKATNKIIVSFEDGTDMDFTDVTFYVDASPEGSVVIPDIPVIDDEEIVYPDYDVTTQGVVAFEDLWPHKGDYDINDVVVRYNSKVTYNKENMVKGTEDTFTPLYSGADIPSAFGYQFGVLSSAVKSVQITYPSGVAPSMATVSANGTEAEQEKATIILFDNALDAVSTKGSYVVKTTFTTPQRAEDVFAPPYNPFIIPAFTTTTTKERKEVHLPKYYAPTSLMDLSLLGTADDKSVPAKGIYFVREGNYPFAIDIPVEGEFRVPEETKPIDHTYPKFTNWVNSGGKENTDWYNYPKN
ncbi:MAG: LruC domain-containing protein [Bacteroidales bacterium]|nr:LruC domain-containing protein [Bacteroidales bacterium]